MKNKIRFVTMSAGLLAAALSVSANAQETQKAAPAVSPAKTAAPALPAKGAGVSAALQAELYKAVANAVKEDAEENEGAYMMFDRSAEDSLALTLVRVGVVPAKKMSDGRYRVRAAFTEAADPEAGKKERKILADFTVSKGEDGWEVVDEDIFSIDGVEQAAAAQTSEGLEKETL
jgi:hypothetical protein